MTGFDNKCLHLRHDAPGEVTFTIELNFLGDGTWSTYDTLSVPAGGYQHHEFPTGYSAHWVRLHCNTDCKATAWFVY